jgi:hypothetical protein
MRRVSGKVVLATLGLLLGGCATTVEMGPGYYHYDTRAAGSVEPAVVYREPTVVYREPTVVYREPAVVYREPAAVYYEPSRSVSIVDLRGVATP